MKTDKATTIWVQKSTRDAINRLKHQGQTPDGYIQELLDGANPNNPDTLKRLDRYRTHARETVGDLIVNALDQLEELEKKFAGSETKR